MRCAAYPVRESRSGRGAPHRGGTPHTGGIDVHKAYGTIALVGHVGTLLREEPRVRIGDGKPSLEALEGFWPVEVVVATCSFWPWIHEILEATEVGFHLAHAETLEAIDFLPPSHRGDGRTDRTGSERLGVALPIAPSAAPSDDFCRNDLYRDNLDAVVLLQPHNMASRR